ncbi:MAG: type II toxin-antitoxin system death-on-curing family toxin [Dehalococcoidia bacterium]|nr:type II toxin-antitoxin system death-on-curing family toxin [Dehalococcoidia bacterium]
MDEVFVLYSELMALDNSDPTTFVRDWGLLESALARPLHAALYDEADLVGQAATLLWGLASNHPFLDGNKRLAHLVTMTFLAINGLDLIARADEQFDLMMAVASGLSSIEAVDQWLRNHLDF